MNQNKCVVETRTVSDFYQVVLRDHFCGGELRISQGDSESLNIEAPENILPRIRSDVVAGKLIIRVDGSWLDRLNDMLSTSLSRPRVIYRLTLKELQVLEIFGAILTKASELNSEKLTIRFRGAGEINIQSLHARSLELVHDGAGTIALEGQVTKQHIKVSGVGSYDGAKLKSENAYVEMRGTGRIIVQVAENLHVNVSGLGSVEYYGNPSIKKHILGLGSIIHLGHA